MDIKIKRFKPELIIILSLAALILFIFSGTIFAHSIFEDSTGYIKYDYEFMNLTMFIPDTYEYIVSEEDVRGEEIVKELATVMFFEESGESIISMDYVVYIEGTLPYGYLNVERELISLVDMYLLYGFELEQLSPIVTFNETNRDSGYAIFSTDIDGTPVIMITGCALGNDYYSTTLFLITYNYFFTYMDEVEFILAQFLFTDEIQTDVNFLLNDIVRYLIY